MIEEAALIEAIRRAADVDPAYVYQNRRGGEPCTYLPNTLNPTCGCIVGDACVDLGVPAERLAALDGHPKDSEVSSSAWGDLKCQEILGDLFAREALTSPWVRSVQEFQDYGHTREDAVRLADTEHSRKKL